MFSQWESNYTLPVLDACGGHYGPTPAYTFTDSAGQVVTIPAQANAYHYHIVSGGPNTIACFGGASSSNANPITVAAAKVCFAQLACIVFHKPLMNHQRELSAFSGSVLIVR